VLVGARGKWCCRPVDVEKNCYGKSEVSLMAKFTAERREQLLALLAAGLAPAQAMQAVGVSRSTVQRLLRSGRAEGASDVSRQFAVHYDAARAGRVNGHGGRLSQDELAGLLEDAARRGVVSAIAELRRRSEKRKPEPADDDTGPVIDVITVLEPASMARLTPEQQQQARELYVRVKDERVARGSEAEREAWRNEREGWLSGAIRAEQAPGDRYPGIVREP
jgi:hypothetical protein